MAVLTFRTVELNDWRESATQLGSEWAMSLLSRRATASDPARPVNAATTRSTRVGATLPVTWLPALLAGEVSSGTPIVVDRIAGTRMEVGDVGE
ncbi:MAG: hypothetical protein WA862_13160 [Solirubrobacterales bacterium]